MAVYFIQGGVDGPIKIGFAKDPHRRIANLQVGAHDQLIVLKIADGPVSRESEIQGKFAHLCLRGEWFTPAPELLQFIADLPGTTVTVTMPKPLDFNRVKRLADYLESYPGGIDAFAVAIRNVPGTVYGWLQGKGIPARNMMRRIHRVTNGMIEPNDFFPEILGNRPIARSAQDAAE